METTENECKESEIVTADELKEKGNEFVKKQDYKKAIEFYSKALNAAENDKHILYSNRSFAYLKNKEYYYALADAERVIELAPDFVKGFYRKAEVLKEICIYEEAIMNYGKALKLEPTNNVLMTNLRSTAAFCNREIMLEKNVPFVGAGCGVIFSIIVIIFDQFTKQPTLKNPLYMVFLVMLIAGFGFAIAKLFRYFLKIHRRGLIEPPVKLSSDFLAGTVNQDVEEEEEEMPKKRNRYTKSQARLRFKKGKS